MLALESYNCTYQNLRFSPSFQLCALTACKSIRFKNLQPSIKFSDCIQPTASLQNLLLLFLQCLALLLESQTVRSHLFNLPSTCRTLDVGMSENQEQNALEELIQLNGLKKCFFSPSLSFLGDNPDGSGVGPPINPDEY